MTPAIGLPKQASRYTGDTGYPRHQGHSGILRDSDTKETHGTHDSALSPSVRTVQDAVDFALNGKMDENCLFRFSRALRTFEQNTGAKIQRKELGGIFELWWLSARKLLGDDASDQEYKFLFLDAFPKTRVPLGANALKRALHLADELPHPKVCDGYDPRLAHLIAVCWHLSNNGGTFYISVRDAADVLKTPSKFFASAMLSGLTSDGLLIVSKKGTAAGRKATQYEFKKRPS